MILVIDTTSSIAAIATLDGRPSEMLLPARSPELLPALRRFASEDISRVAVATGPGSFTGLRVGVSFGLGLAMGLRIPIVPLPSLDLQAARSLAPATAVLEAGRGRVYYQAPGAKPAHGEPADVPASHPLVGTVSARTEAALIAARHRFVPAAQLQGFAAAAAKVLEVAHEVPYRNLEITYMQTFSPGRP